MELSFDIFKEKTVGPQYRLLNIGTPVKPVPMTMDQAKSLCTGAGIEYQPGYESRILRRITTTEKPDRMGDIVRAVGVDNTNYRKNAVVLFAHQHGNLPIGASLDEKMFQDENTKGWTSDDLHFDNNVDTTGRSDLVFRFAKSGAMRGGSIGFKPILTKTDYSPTEREKMGMGTWGVDYQKVEKLEHSACAIPAHPDALSLAIKDMDLTTFHKEDLDIMEKFLMLDGNIVDVFSKAITNPKGLVISIGKGSSSSGQWGSNVSDEDAEQSVADASDAAELAADAESHADASDQHTQAHNVHMRMAAKCLKNIGANLHKEAAKLHKIASTAHQDASDNFNDDKSTVAKMASREAGVMSRAAFTASKEQLKKSIENGTDNNDKVTVNVNFDVKALAEELRPLLSNKHREPEASSKGIDFAKELYKLKPASNK